jgi:mannose-6-phosphate isomerase-like protein (cupin superfamily)
MIIKKADAVSHGREGVNGTYYQLPHVQNGTTVAYAEFTGEHGQRTVGDRERLYFILEGDAEFEINGEKTRAYSGDLVIIPQKATYNLWPKSPLLKVLLYMEYIQF